MDGDYALILEQLFIVGVDFCIGGAVFLCGLNCSLLNNVAESNHFDLFNIFKGGQMLAVGDTAAADNAYSDFLHINSFSFVAKAHLRSSI